MHRWRTVFAVLGTAVFAAVLSVSPAAAQTTSWPQQIDAPEGSVVVYQPQFETFKGNVVTGPRPPMFGRRWTART